jgi:hypothetical protein
VNALFAKRLQEILRICVPSLMSKEAFLVMLQACFLVSRTLLTGLPFISVFLRFSAHGFAANFHT